MLKFLFPIDGDVVTPADGILLKNGGLELIAEIQYDGKEIPYLNGRPCDRKDDRWICPIVISDYLSPLRLECEGKCEVICVYRFKNAYMKYRLAIDDVIITMKKIAEERPASLFDDPFFAFFRSLYEDYGTKTQLNVYETDGEGFTLSEFPDCYKKEFEASLPWLRLTFHARADEPARIYKNAPYGEVFTDFHRVTNEIKRFAGDAIWRTSANGLHFAETNREGARALRDCGCDCLVGYFIFDKQGEPAVSYYLDKEMTTHLAKRDFWVDRKEHIIFSRDKIVLDQTPLEEIAPKLSKMKRDLRTLGALNFVTHEQYFYPFYKHYRPDYCDRIRKAVEWAQQEGYSPAFLDENIYE